LGLVAASAYNNCWQYNGWQWVNVCYSPYGYGYGYGYGNRYGYY
jgi:hypothetical protein